MTLNLLESLSQLPEVTAGANLLQSGLQSGLQHTFAQPAGAESCSDTSRSSESSEAGMSVCDETASTANQEAISSNSGCATSPTLLQGSAEVETPSNGKRLRFLDTPFSESPTGPKDRQTI